MNDSGTPQGTGSTVADAAERIASLLGPADSEDDETRDEESSDADEDEADPDEGDAEAEDGESDEQGEDPDEADEQPELHTVKVAGEEVQVTLEEALKGYSREQDYVRKTQALADQRRSAEREIAEVRAAYQSKLDSVTQLLEASQPRVDQSLRDTNPAEWSAQMLQHRMWAEQRSAVAQERESLSAQAQAEEAAALAETVKAETEKLLIAIPEWSDPKVAEAEHAKLRSTGTDHYGFTPDEINGLTDHRMVRVLRDAVRYRELQAKSVGVRAKVETVKTARPGAASAAPSRVREVDRAKQRLRQSGRVEDAQAAIERMLG